MAEKSSKSTMDTFSELRELLVAYLKQETVEPLKGVGRYLAYGIPGALLVSIGVVMLALAALRALQTETGSTFTGNLSWIPYLIVLAGLCVLAGLAARAITGGGAER